MLPETALWAVWGKAGEQYKGDHFFFFFLISGILENPDS